VNCLVFYKQDNIQVKRSQLKCMADDSLTEQDVRRALELANTHLEEAENVLWTAANRVESPEITDEIESVTQRVWNVQHDLLDFQRKLE